jgi:DNA-cytosine methyltransferase
MTLKIGSLFAGYSGLDRAVSAVTGGEVAWFSEFDPAPSKILAYHYPGVPNYGDITKINWNEVEPVDILTGGFPCQDLSLAGKRAGLKDGTRSGLWSEFAKAIDELNPRMVVIENVRGILSANAHSDLEPCPWCMGEAGDGEPPLRALGVVLGSLSSLGANGYDARWVGVRAADAGAPHSRFRIFIVGIRRGGGELMPTPTVFHIGMHDEPLEKFETRQAKSSTGQIGKSLGVALRYEQNVTLLRSPKASEGRGGALGEAEAIRRGNTVGVRDQVLDLVASQGLKVSRTERNASTNTDN